MRPSVKIASLLPLILSVILLNSCEKKSSTEDTSTGLTQFSFTTDDNTAVAKAGGSDSILSSYHLVISVEDLQGHVIMTDRVIPVYVFGSGFISDQVEIRSGEYKLTKFFVIDPSGKAILASPLEGAPLAYLINDPLPLYFSVLPGQVTSVVPEVLVVGTYTPGDFGYASFGVQVITPLEFWAICYLDNPLIMAPTQITDAKLTIISAQGWSYTFYLKAEINHLVIRGGSDFYQFVLEKDGYVTQMLQFSAKELMATSREQPLGLKIPWGQQYKVLELQPGPEAGKDAMISNLQPDENFGDYKYFEATFLSEPVLTVMRSNRSLIDFDLGSLPGSAAIQKVVLRLSFDLPIPVDSSMLYPDPNTGVTPVAGVLQQIIEPWDEHKVTWNNSPRTIEMNQVFVYPFIKNANFIDVDVTKFYVNPSASALPYYGMLFRQWPDNSFPGLRFASSDYPEPAMRPKLIIYYTL